MLHLSCFFLDYSLPRLSFRMGRALVLQKDLCSGTAGYLRAEPRRTRHFTPCLPPLPPSGTRPSTRSPYRSALGSWICSSAAAWRSFGRPLTTLANRPRCVCLCRIDVRTVDGRWLYVARGNVCCCYFSARHLLRKVQSPLCLPPIIFFFFFLQEVLRLPRPPPPVVRLELHYSAE